MWLDLESGGQGPYVRHACVTFCALDEAHDGPGQAGQVSQLLLAEATGLTKLPYALTVGLEFGTSLLLAGPGHRRLTLGRRISAIDYLEVARYVPCHPNSPHGCHAGSPRDEGSACRIPQSS